MDAFNYQNFSYDDLLFFFKLIFFMKGDVQVSQQSF